jgi:hypothetical protein
MNFPKFWARGEAQGFCAWGWSNESVAQAKALGVEVAQRIATRIGRGDRSRPGHYEYGDRPLREEVLREFRDEAGELSAVITRNSYGCLVLNAAHLLFVDVDLCEEPPPGGVLGWLLGFKKAAARLAAARQSVLDRAEAWTRQNPGWGWRVYETRAGLRLVAIHRPFAYDDAVCAEVFEALGADPLYRRLCGHQKCFRARLTPKPWRCKVPNPPARWPFEDSRHAAAVQRWETQYLQAAAGYATCCLIAQIGTTDLSPDLAELVAAHDEVSRCGSGLPLA